jgi:uncharacterized protein YbaR (Trm112 family)
MHLDLVDVLRCQQPHDGGWLVCAAVKVRGRELLDGWLSCPICEAQYPIRDGLVTYGPFDRAAHVAPEPSEADVLQLAAALELTRPGLLVALAGRWAAFAGALQALVPTRFVLVNGPSADGLMEPAVIASLAGARGLPLPTGQLHAIALDEGHLADAPLADAMRTLSAGGRLVLPPGGDFPDGVEALAEDARLRVGVRGALSSRPVPLRRGTRQ